MWGMDTPAAPATDPSDPVLDLLIECVHDVGTARAILIEAHKRGYVFVPAEQACYEVNFIDPAPVVVLKTTTVLSGQEVNFLAERLAPKMGPDGLLLALAPGEDVEAITAPEMERLGWVRKETA